MSTGEICANTLQRLRNLQLHVQLCTDGGVAGVPSSAWIGASDLRDPDGSLAPLLARFAAQGFAVNRRAAAAALLLRLGWTSGFAIAAYLACNRVPRLTEYALYFSPRSLLHTVWIKAVSFHGLPGDALAGAGDWVGDTCGDESAPRILKQPGRSSAEAGPSLSRALLASLLEFSEPLVDVYHRWSGFSRHALWSMVVSSWGAQFTSVARQLGDAARGIAEARELFSGHPEIAHAAPQLYEVQAGDSVCTCQRRAACCLYFKSPGRPFCASCPILSEAERHERNWHWVRAQRTLACA